MEDARPEDTINEPVPVDESGTGLDSSGNTAETAATDAPGTDPVISPSEESAAAPTTDVLTSQDTQVLPPLPESAVTETTSTSPLEAGAAIAVPGAAPADASPMLEPQKKPEFDMGEGRRGRNLTWLWILLAFLLGIGPALGLFFYERNLSRSTARALRLQIKDLENDLDLTGDRGKQQDERMGKLESGIASLTADIASIRAQQAAEASRNAQSLQFVGRVLEPASITTTSGALTYTLTTAGISANVVWLQVQSTSGANYTRTYELKSPASTGAITTWKKTQISNPKRKGTYVVYCWAFANKRQFADPSPVSFTIAK